MRTRARARHARAMRLLPAPLHAPLSPPAASLAQYVVTRWYRAPELLCESEIYGSPVDVWAVGCVLAELLSRRILFKGNSTREQLQLIIEKLGVPGPDDMTGITSPAVIDTIRRMGAGATHQPLSEQFPGASPLALDLLARLLTFDQIKRCTVDEALSHPYLWEMHSRACEPVSDEPFDWAFERDFPDEMPQAVLQHHIFAEIQALRASTSHLVAQQAAAATAAAAAEAAQAADAAAAAAAAAQAAQAQVAAAAPAPAAVVVAAAADRGGGGVSSQQPASAMEEVGKS